MDYFKVNSSADISLLFLINVKLIMHEKVEGNFIACFKFVSPWYSSQRFCV